MTTTLVCVECEALARSNALGWEAHLVDMDDDGEDEVVYYCPRCARREFGSRDVDARSLD